MTLTTLETPTAILRRPVGMPRFCDHGRLLTAHCYTCEDLQRRKRMLPCACVNPLCRLDHTEAEHE